MILNFDLCKNQCCKLNSTSVIWPFKTIVIMLYLHVYIVKVHLATLARNK